MGPGVFLPLSVGINGVECRGYVAISMAAIRTQSEARSGESCGRKWWRSTGCRAVDEGVCLKVLAAWNTPWHAVQSFS